jgi:hypothetical protein
MVTPPQFDGVERNRAYHFMDEEEIGFMNLAGEYVSPYRYCRTHDWREALRAMKREGEDRIHRYLRAGSDSADL